MAVIDSFMINNKDFIKSLDQVIKKDDKVIVIYSGISSFLNKIEYKKNIVSELLSLIENFVTKKRTLIFPSFSANIFLKTKKFDLKNSIDNIGILSKEALKRNYFRTPQPLHSYLIFGRDIKDIRKLSHKTSWGDGSILDYMSKNDARICTLGLSWNKGCAYLHRFEEKYQAPWRYFKKFKGDMYIGKKLISECTETKYSLPNFSGELYDYSPFIKYIKKTKSYCKNTHRDFSIESVKAKCLDKVGKKIFLKDPWCIIKEKSKIINWIKYKKINDIILNK